MLLTLAALSASAQDADIDGFDVAAGDCDDADADVHPGATETCNGGDDDCDPTTPDGVMVGLWQDLDGDDAGAGVESPGCAAEDGNSGYWLEDDDGARLVVAGFVENDDDCNNYNANISPAAEEVCDDLDNDCDDTIDNAVVGGLLFFEDADGDGYGAGEGSSWCSPPTEASVTAGGDCDDLDPSANPGAEEVGGDGVDNDCDGLDDDDGAPADQPHGAQDAKDDEGCGCSSSGLPVAPLLLVPLALLRRRSRRR